MPSFVELFLKRIVQELCTYHDFLTCAKDLLISFAKALGWGELQTIRRSSISGCFAAKDHATAPPQS